MKFVKLTRGYITAIDNDDLEWVNSFLWHTTGPVDFPYAARRTKLSEGINGAIVTLHRTILNAPDGMDVDHKNGNTLDNRRANLRLATRSQNRGNAPKPKGDRTSKYKNVIKRGHYWVVAVTGKHIGTFSDEVEAARAADSAAIEIFGEFAWLNFGSSDAFRVNENIPDGVHIFRGEHIPDCVYTEPIQRPSKPKKPTNQSRLVDYVRSCGIVSLDDIRKWYTDIGSLASVDTLLHRLVKDRRLAIPKKAYYTIPDIQYKNLTD